MTELTKTQQKEVEKQVEKVVKKRLSSRLLEKTTFFGSEFKKQTATAIIAAFGFLVALVWRDLILKVVENISKTSLLEKYPYIAELYTAIIVTIIAVIVIALISRWSQKPENK